MMDQSFIWQIVNIVLAMLLAVSTTLNLNKYVSNDFTRIFFFIIEIIIILIPILDQLCPYFKFLTTNTGTPIMLIIIACFEFRSINSFLYFDYWVDCYSNVISLIVTVVAIIEIFMRKEPGMKADNIIQETQKESSSQAQKETRNNKKMASKMIPKKLQDIDKNKLGSSKHILQQSELKTEKSCLIQ